MSTILTIRFQVSAIDPLAAGGSGDGCRESVSAKWRFRGIHPGIPGSSN
nr:hypothetical protein [Burkholderia sp. AU33423]